MNEVQTVNKRPKILAIVGIIISWATFWLWIFSPFGLLAWIGILIYLKIKKYKLKWYIILSAWLFVPSCSFLKGTINYATGTARLQNLGGPRTYHGIDIETRIPRTSSGCIPLGFEPFVFITNNVAIRLCTNIFGYQRGSYTGYFPTENEAKKIINSADTINVENKNGYLIFKIDNQNIKLDSLAFYNFRYSSDTYNKVIGSVIKNECFVFRPIHENKYESDETTYIIDIKGNEILTMY